ncbi:hypothetical protein BKA81DRAFT_375382 [Phyllosticta paracitricarpa]
MPPVERWTHEETSRSVPSWLKNYHAQTNAGRSTPKIRPCTISHPDNSHLLKPVHDGSIPQHLAHLPRSRCTKSTRLNPQGHNKSSSRVVIFFRTGCPNLMSAGSAASCFGDCRKEHSSDGQTIIASSLARLACHDYRCTIIIIVVIIVVVCLLPAKPGPRLSCLPASQLSITFLSQFDCSEEEEADDDVTRTHGQT